MWIFLSNAFLSIVDDENDSSRLLVRARLPKDISRIFPDANVVKTPSRDYRYRTFVPRAEVAKVLAAQVEKIDYPNFKNSVKEDDRHQAYLGVWNIMYDLQQRR